MTIPQLPDKLGEPSIIAPRHFAEHNAEHGLGEARGSLDAIILVYHRGFAEEMARHHRARHVPQFVGDHWLLHEFDERVAIVAGFGIGAPAATFVAESAIGEGARLVMSVGTCGAIDASLPIGSMVVPDGAIRDEGTSYHYVRADQPARADEKLTTALAAAVDDHASGEVPVTRHVDVWTTDAPFRETALELRHWRERNVAAVEMEQSALMVLGAVHEIQVAAALVVSDVLSEHDWTPSFHAEPTWRGLRIGFDAALDVLRARL